MNNSLESSVTTLPVIIIVDDDAGFRGAMTAALEKDYEVKGIGSLAELTTVLSPTPDVALVDLALDPGDPSNRDGLEVLRRLRERIPWLPVLMITGHGDVDVAVQAMRAGAADFISKSASLREVRARIEKSVRQSELGSRVGELERELSLVRPREIIGNSARMQEVRRLIEIVARDGRVTVLVRGETGTGKELVARAIHASGWRAKGPFVPVMLTALPQGMIETEMFGFERGAFTDARDQHIGYLERAHKGVLLLDEIGEVEPDTQVKILRFLEEREFQRLGSTTPQRVDVQIVAATNANLENQVRSGKLREDLYFRLKVHEIVLPPLRERAEDIPLLVEYFQKLFRREGRRTSTVSPGAMRTLQWFPWPGNVRQLRNVLESALFWAEARKHAQIEMEDLPAELQTASARGKTDGIPRVGDADFRLEEELARTELRLTSEALTLAGGRKTEAWKLLGHKNRFSIRRRVTRLMALHPGLKEEFQELVKLYGIPSGVRRLSR